MSCTRRERSARKKQDWQILSLTEWEFVSNPLENSGSSRSQCSSAAWFLLTLSWSLSIINKVHCFITTLEYLFTENQRGETNRHRKKNNWIQKHQDKTNKSALSNLVRGTQHHDPQNEQEKHNRKKKKVSKENGRILLQVVWDSKTKSQSRSNLIQTES